MGRKSGSRSGSISLSLPFEELTRCCSLLNYFAQPDKLIYPLIWLHVTAYHQDRPSLQMAHRTTLPRFNIVNSKTHPIDAADPIRDHIVSTVRAPLDKAGLFGRSGEVAVARKQMELFDIHGQVLFQKP